MELAPAPAPPLLRSLALTRLSQGRFDEARDVGRELRARGERDDDPVMLVEGHYVLGIAAFWPGQMAAAREHFEAAVAGARPEHRATHLLRYGLDPHVVCLSRLANTLLFLGEPEAAVRTRDDALALADEVGHPASSATARVFAGALSVDLGDIDALRTHAAALRAGGLEHHQRAAVVATETYLGYLEVVDGDREGIERIRRAVDDARAAPHAPGSHALAIHVLIEACARAGDAEAGLAAADEALATVGGARLYEAQTQRRREAFLAALRE
jgi:hypothetical protein